MGIPLETLRPRGVRVARAYERKPGLVLSLDPTLVYLLSQLWISFEKRDGDQWKYYLSELAKNKKVTTDKLKQAAVLWKHIVQTSPAPTTESVRGTSGQLAHPGVERIEGLFGARLDAYRELTQMLTSASMAEEARRQALVAPADGPLTVWYRKNGLLLWYRKNGLLLSGNSLDRFLRLRNLLAGESGDNDLPEALRLARSALRTELKIDLGVRHPDERDEPTDRPRRPE